MLALVVALAIAPWSHPLAFQSMSGWQLGASGTAHSMYSGETKRTTPPPLESAAWIAHGVRYNDAATADPPNKTLSRLKKNAIIVWAVIYSPAAQGDPLIRLDLNRAKRFACCEAVGIPAEYELTGAGPRHAYSVIVRIYFGSAPNPALRAQAQQALQRLRLPTPR